MFFDGVWLLYKYLHKHAGIYIVIACSAGECFNMGSAGGTTNEISVEKMEFMGRAR